MIPQRSKAASKTAKPRIRVAIYTRQSVARDLEFGSIEAQRDAIEAYVLSRKADGWEAIATRYDDEGWSGKNTDRPAFKRLLADLDSGLLDAIACYKLDRISRSVADLTRFVASLDERGVGFVCTSQSIDTRGSTGRLLLHLLGAVAQFERETIAERTRDKILATRRRGMWTSGRPTLGYDIRDKQLVVNERGAADVAECFAVYMRLRSLREAVAELSRRGIRQLVHRFRDGTPYGGKPFTRQALHRLLTSPIVVGLIPCGDELVPGKHEAIIDRATWDLVQERLRQNARSTNAEHRNRYGALLRGIAYCGVCGSPMRHDITTRQGRAYRSYSCRKLQVEGAQACPGSRAPGPDLEQFVLDRVRGVGSDPRVFDAAVIAARAEADALRPSLQAQVHRLQAERRKLEGEREGLLAAAAENPASSGPALSRVAAIDACFPSLDARIGTAHEQLARLDSRALDLHSLRGQLAGFDSLFEQLTSAEQCRLVALVIERVDVDVPRAAIRVTFRGTPPADSVRTTA